MRVKHAAKLGAALAGSTAAITAQFVAAPEMAHANATSCRFISPVYNSCNYVRGGGLYVEYSEATVSNNTFPVQICGWQYRFFGTYENGKRYETFSPYRSDCAYTPTASAIINANMQAGSDLCTDVMINGIWANQYACVRIT